MDNNQKLLAISEAANYLGISEFTLRSLDKDGKLIPLKSEGGHRRYSIEILDSWKFKNALTREYSMQKLNVSNWFQEIQSNCAKYKDAIFVITKKSLFPYNEISGDFKTNTRVDGIHYQLGLLPMIYPAFLLHDFSRERPGYTNGLGASRYVHMKPAIWQPDDNGCIRLGEQAEAHEWELVSYLCDLSLVVNVYQESMQIYSSFGLTDAQDKFQTVTVIVLHDKALEENPSYNLFVESYEQRNISKSC